MAGVREGAPGGLDGGFGRSLCCFVRWLVSSDAVVSWVHMSVVKVFGCRSSGRSVLNRNLSDESQWPATGSPLKIVLIEAELSEKK